MKIHLRLALVCEGGGGGPGSPVGTSPLCPMTGPIFGVSTSRRPGDTYPDVGSREVMMWHTNHLIEDHVRTRMDGGRYLASLVSGVFCGVHKWVTHVMKTFLTIVGIRENRCSSSDVPRRSPTPWVFPRISCLPPTHTPTRNPSTSKLGGQRPSSEESPGGNEFGYGGTYKERKRLALLLLSTKSTIDLNVGQL
jgi:hypothetical protein